MPTIQKSTSIQQQHWNLTVLNSPSPKSKDIQIQKECGKHNPFKNYYNL